MTHPVRLCVAAELGHQIDGAWWPRSDRMANELSLLVATLRPLVGDITAIDVNWPALQRPPDFNWGGWQHKRQHVMTIQGQIATVNLLIVPYATHDALATMVLRRAANLPIDAGHQNKPAFATASAIVRAAQQQSSAPTPTPT